MIAKLAKAVLKLILPDVTEHLLKVFKLDRLVDHMELENDTDRAVKSVKSELKSELEMIKSELKEVNAVIAKIKNKKIFKSLNG